MKITVNVNLAGLSYTIDQDGYDLLKSYLEDIESRIESDTERQEMLDDIEARISDILSEMTISSPRVVTIFHVRKAIETIGTPELFGQKKSANSNTNTSTPNQDRKLMRDTSDSILGGVCSGMAAYLALDTVLVRVIAVVLAFFGGITIIAYIVAIILIPATTTEEDQEIMRKMKQSR